MGGKFGDNQNYELRFQLSFEEAYILVKNAADKCGKIVMENKALGLIQFRVQSGVRNAATFSANVAADGDSSSIVKIAGNCGDGTVGLNSMGKAYEKFVKCLSDVQATSSKHTSTATTTPSGVVQYQTKKKKKFHWWYVLILLVIIGVFGSIGNDEQADSSAPSVSNSATSSAPTTPTTPKTIPYEVELTSGFYTAGIDFPAGKYDIEAVAGGGNVSSNNMFSGGLNLVMGVEEKDAAFGTDLYEQSYKNAKLDKGVVLSVSGGVTIKISSEAASADPLTPREQDITDAVQLGSGNYVAGKDFSAGVYDITAVSGNGNVSSSNMFDGGLNAVMGTDTSMDFYEKSYKNVELTSGVELTVSGVSIELTPSK